MNFNFKIKKCFSRIKIEKKLIKFKLKKIAKFQGFELNI